MLIILTFISIYNVVIREYMCTRTLEKVVPFCRLLHLLLTSISMNWSFRYGFKSAVRTGTAIIYRDKIL
jgi:hypothetical protein